MKETKMNKIILSIGFCAVLLGCKDEPAPPPPPVVKQQKVIFDVTTVSCKGNELCQAYIAMAQSTCSQMATTLSSQMSQGWRVVTSTKKERLAASSGPAVCEGTEYVLEK
jgi:fumarylacetoacetate (FAA) hydrolase family protein